MKISAWKDFLPESLPAKVRHRLRNGLRGGFLALKNRELSVGSGSLTINSILG
jgi:hypothetical protein